MHWNIQKVHSSSHEVHVDVKEDCLNPLWVEGSPHQPGKSLLQQRKGKQTIESAQLVRYPWEMCLPPVGGSPIALTLGCQKILRWKFFRFLFQKYMTSFPIFRVRSIQENVVFRIFNSKFVFLLKFPKNDTLIRTPKNPSLLTSM